MAQIRRKRSIKKVNKDNADIAQRVMDFYNRDDADRSEEKEIRLQRYAKYRMWVEQKDWPWEASSNTPLPDMAEKSLHLQDVLHNAVMSSRPVINAKSTTDANKGKESTIDALIDHQIFIDQRGEDLVGDLAEAFVNDGVYVAFIPWVTDTRKVSDSKIFPRIPDEMLPVEYFLSLLIPVYGQENIRPIETSQGWDFDIRDRDEEFKGSFYTKKNNEVEFIVQRTVQVFDGPLVIQKEWEDVLYPSNAGNLHAPSQSNPNGAGHVIILDYPSYDEVAKLQKSGVYDRLDTEELEKMQTTSTSVRDDYFKDQKADMQGTTHFSASDTLKDAFSQKTLTRIRCFDTWDIDGDGVAEDLEIVMILETKSVCRARLLGEVYPSYPPRRPLVHKSLFPVRGRVSGISLLELMEGLHDDAKTLIDQVIDAGTMSIAPPWFYNPSSTVNPEIITLSPGEGYPLRDVNFPNINNNGQVMGLNLFSMLETMQERVTTIGDLQLGRVPKGKSSALRTQGSIAMIQGQGEARPERILRRFFGGLTEIWQHIHGLNGFFLKDGKAFKLTKTGQPGENPYAEVSRNDISGMFNFDFKANVFNASKQQLQESLQGLMGTLISELTLQTGIVTPDGIYRLLRQWAIALGQDPDMYLNPPSPDALRPKISALEAIAVIMDTQIPDGTPREPGGWEEHVQVLVQFVEGDEFGLLDSTQVEIFKTYLENAQKAMQLQQQQQQLAAAAEQFGGEGGSPQGRPPGPQENPNSPTQVNSGELLDESLPGAGGGANPEPIR